MQCLPLLMVRHKPALSQELNSHFQHPCSSELMHLNGSGLQPAGHTSEAGMTLYTCLCLKSRVLVVLSSTHSTEHLLIPTNYSLLFALNVSNYVSISPARGSKTTPTTTLFISHVLLFNSFCFYSAASA